MGERRNHQGNRKVRQSQKLKQYVDRETIKSHCQETFRRRKEDQKYNAAT